MFGNVKGVNWRYWSSALTIVIGAAAALGSTAEVNYLNADAAQYLSSAKSLPLEFSTELIHYDEQYRYGNSSSPQTVFPPGLPLIISALAFFVDETQALFFAGIASYCLIGVLIAGAMPESGTGRFFGLAALTLWMSHSYAWGNVLLGLSDTTYTFFTLASILLCAKSKGRLAVLFAASVFAAIAVLVRYQGVFFILALGLWACRPVLSGTLAGVLRAAREASILVALPVATFASLAIRNLVLSGGVGGGPVDTAESGVLGMDVLRQAYWTVSKMTGLSFSSLAAGAFAEVLFFTAASLMLVLTAIDARPQSSPVSPNLSTAEESALNQLGIIYIVVSCVGLSYLAVTRSELYLQGRFFLPIVPVLIILGVRLLYRAVNSRIGRAKLATILATLCIFMSLLIGQGRTGWTLIEDLRSQERYTAIERAMGDVIGDVPMRSFLAKSVSTSAPILADHGQYLWLVLRRPVLSASPFAFSRMSWDEQLVKNLINCYGVRYVAVFPPLVQGAAPFNSSARFFADLHSGLIPRYLTLTHKSPSLVLFSVNEEATSIGNDCKEWLKNFAERNGN